MKYLIFLIALTLSAQAQAHVVCKVQNQCTPAEEKAQLLLRVICQRFGDVLMKQTGGAAMAAQDKADWDELNVDFPKWFGGKKFDPKFCPKFQPIAMSPEISLTPGGVK